MQDVVIHRCTICFVRRGGWSWGPDPRRLLRNAIEAIPAIVAARLADLLRDAPGDFEVPAPMRIRIPLRLADLRAGASGAAAAHAPPQWVARLEQELQECVRSIDIVPQRSASAESISPVLVDAERESSAAVLADALVDWRLSGTLEAVLTGAGDPLAAAWLRALASADSTWSAQLQDVVRRVLADPSDSSGSDSPSGSRSAASILIEVAAHLTSTGVARPEVARHGLETPPVDGLVRAPLVTHAPAGAREETSTNPPSVVVRRSDGASTESPRVAGGAKASMSSPLVDVELRVPSALPWLMLVPLHKVGYLRMLGAALELARLESQAGMFGAALAYKVTGADARLWRKSAATERLAAAAASQRDAVSMPELSRFAQRIAPYCRLLDGQVMHAIVAGRSSDQPWLVHRLSSDLLGSFAVIDPDGMFPVRWDANHEEVVDLVRATPGPDVLVPEDAADPVLLRHLDGSGVRFLTTARPSRAERWVRLPASGSQMWWSNWPGSVAPPTRRWMPHIADLASRSNALGVEFNEQRVTLALAGHVPSSETAEFRLDERCQLFEGGGIAVAPCTQKLGDHSW